MKKIFLMLAVSLSLAGCEEKVRTLSSSEIGGATIVVIEQAPVNSAKITGEVLPSGVGVKNIQTLPESDKLHINVEVSNKKMDKNVSLTVALPPHVNEVLLGSDSKSIWKKNVR